MIMVGGVHFPSSTLGCAKLAGTLIRKGRLGARLVSVPSVHVSKNILLVSNNINNNNFNYFNYNNIPTSRRRKRELYILAPKFSSSSLSSSSSSSSHLPHSVGERDRDNIDHKSIRVSSSSEMGYAQNPIQNKDQQDQSTKLLTLPTVLTLSRVAAIPLFIATFYVNSWWGTSATTSIFVAAAITDWLDGYLARKMRLGTVFGAFLDPVADKLMVAATLVLLCSRPPEIPLLGDVPWLFPVPAIAIIGREITMSAVREWAASQDTKLLQAVAVNNLGKWKTATQMTALTILVATRDSSLAGSATLATSGVALLYVSAGLALWSLAVYMRKIWKVLSK
ncbi:CDP-diacylglycerol--glycerol-3-phosphate 3-phosphatidyltransferase 2-like [Silene latifolia]